MDIVDVTTYKQLIDFLEGWTTIYGEEVTYDLFGMAGLLRACLTNLSSNCGEEDWADLIPVFPPAERAAILVLAARIQDALPYGEEDCD